MWGMLLFLIPLYYMQFYHQALNMNLYLGTFLVSLDLYPL